VTKEADPRENAAPTKTNKLPEEAAKPAPSNDEEELSDGALGQVSGGLGEAIHRAQRSPLA
jgi:hypothetical protein